MLPVETLWFWPALAGAALLLVLQVVEGLSVQLCRKRQRLATGWLYLASLLELLAAVAILLGGLSAGLWRGDEAGLQTPDWSALADWLPGYAAGMALWVALLFYVAWRREANREPAPRQGLVSQAARLVRDETLLAILRAALAPALGIYWGAWAAAGLRLATRWWLPAGAQARRTGKRTELLLPGALDVAATVVVIMAASAWPALATRIAIYIISQGARTLARHAARRANRRQPQGSDAASEA